MMTSYSIHPDIREAETLPGRFYRDTSAFERMRERVFAQSWQWIGDLHSFQEQPGILPVSLLDGFLHEPMLIARDGQGQLRCLSNVCTHRANILANHPSAAKEIRCMYHGRRFNLEGKMVAMPEFKEALHFPRDCDHLKTFPLESLSPFYFTGIQPKIPFKTLVQPILDRMDFLPLHQFRYSPLFSKEYLVNAHWALYCDNYLEGFHIPFVHQDLNAVLDYGSYTTLLFDHLTLQIGYADDSATHIFELPPNHPDYGKRVAAYYFWVFPNLMLNFYPWGLSVNVVKPIQYNTTKVSFITYLWNESLLHQGAGALLDKVEREDEFVVEGVFKGIHSTAYTTGRYSPTRETGVHHFHRLLCAYLKD